MHVVGLTQEKQQTIVFDLGEVLSRPIGLLEDIAAYMDIPVSAFSEDYWRWRPHYDEGLSPGQYWAKVFANSGIVPSADQVRQLSRIDCSAWTRLAPAEIQLLEELKTQGCLLVLLSNAPSEMGEVVRAQPWAELFDTIFISADIGLAKPDQRIYRIVEQQLGVEDPHDLIFFDDRSDNVEGARACGWQAIRWESIDQLRDELQARGLLPSG